MYMVIEKISNSYGRGYEVRTGNIYRRYYGYSKRDAVARFRAEFNLKYKRFITVEL